MVFDKAQPLTNFRHVAEQGEPGQSQLAFGHFVFEFRDPIRVQLGDARTGVVDFDMVKSKPAHFIAVGPIRPGRVPG